MSTTSRRELSSSIFFLQGKVPKEIQAILTETLACSLPGRVKDLITLLLLLLLLLFTGQGAEGNSSHSDRNISLFPSWLS